MDSGRTSHEPWRVGVLFSQTGATAAVERTQLNATLLAVEELNEGGGIDGREIVPVIYDPGADPQKFTLYADKLLTEDRVNVIFGCYMSSTRKAVAPVVERRNGLLCYPTLYEGFEYSPNTIYTGAAPNQNSVQLADYLMKNFGLRFYLVGSNYIYPYESNRIVADLVAECGGQVVAERYVPLNSSTGTFEKIVEDIKAKAPDVVFSTVVGADTARFYRAFAAAGLSAKTMPIASLTTCEAEVQMMGAEAAEGHITAAPYFANIDTPANRRFVAAYAKKFGADGQTNMCCEAAYFQVHVVAAALQRTGSLDTDVLRPAILGTELNAPQGMIRIDPDNNHTYLWPRIARVDENGHFVILEEALAPVKPDPYLVTHSLADWTRTPSKVLVRPLSEA